MKAHCKHSNILFVKRKNGQERMGNIRAKYRSTLPSTKKLKFIPHQKKISKFASSTPPPPNIVDPPPETAEIIYGSRGVPPTTTTDLRSAILLAVALVDGDLAGAGSSRVRSAQKGLDLQVHGVDQSLVARRSDVIISNHPHKLRNVIH